MYRGLASADYVRQMGTSRRIHYCMGRPTSCIPQVYAGKTVLSLGHENIGIRLHIYFFYHFFFFLIGYAASKKIIHKKLIVKKYTQTQEFSKI